MQPTIPGSQYGDNYQQSSAVTFRRPYNAAPTYQPVPQPIAPQPSMFVPSPAAPAPLVSPIWFGLYIIVTVRFVLLLQSWDLIIVFNYHCQGDFPPPPVNTQPPAAKFVPANPPLLRNAEQYQQPSTLGSQLYPV